jgi:predicted nuclease with TOPRIM domain
MDERDDIVHVSRNVVVGAARLDPVGTVSVLAQRIRDLEAQLAERDGEIEGLRELAGELGGTIGRRDEEVQRLRALNASTAPERVREAEGDVARLEGWVSALLTALEDDGHDGGHNYGCDADTCPQCSTRDGISIERAAIDKAREG